MKEIISILLFYLPTRAQFTVTFCILGNVDVHLSRICVSIIRSKIIMLRI